MGIDRYVYAAGDTSWSATFMERLEKQSKGYNAVSLSNFDTTAVCVITDGSSFEIAGSMYLCTTDTSIGGSLATGLCYIMATGASATASVAWSTTAPVWRDDFQGYYATAASSVRALGGCDSNGANCKEKWVYHKQEDMNYTRASGSLRPLKTKIVKIGDWNMDITTVLTIAHGLSDIETIRKTVVIIRPDSGVGGVRHLDNVTSGTITQQGGYSGITSTNINLTRLTGGTYDHVNYDATSYNRGWINIDYEDGQ